MTPPARTARARALKAKSAALGQARKTGTSTANSSQRIQKYPFARQMIKR